MRTPKNLRTGLSTVPLGHSRPVPNVYGGRASLPLVQRAETASATEDKIDHPAYYRGADNPYEAIKVIEAWNAGFHLGNVLKYIARAGSKGSYVEDLEKARWYLDRAIFLAKQKT